MRKLIPALFLVAVLISGLAPAQTERRPALDAYLEQAKALSTHPQVMAAFASVEKNREGILREWRAITEVNAPSGKEKPRAALIEKLLRGYRLQNIYYDAAGNLIAVRKGTGGGPTVVFDAHMDTVFQDGLTIKAEVREGRIYAPGVGDDTRNIEAMLASIRALDEAKIETKGDLVFVFTVEEETTFRGVKQFVKDNKERIGYYVALDGGYEGLTYGGIGIHWYRFHMLGPGGHTRSQTPPYSATLPLARAISRLYELQLPADPPTHLNIGMLGGSDVVNAKAADAWFTVDLRSTSNEVIAQFEKKIEAIVREEAERAGMTVKMEVISKTPAALLPGHRDSLLVLMAEAIHMQLGFENPPVTPTGSNNSNIALALGVPAISTGAADCSGSHSLSESCEVETIYRGIKKVLLLEIALAQLSPPAR